MNKSSLLVLLVVIVVLSTSCAIRNPRAFQFQGEGISGLGEYNLVFTGMAPTSKSTVKIDKKIVATQIQTMKLNGPNQNMIFVLFPKNTTFAPIGDKHKITICYDDQFCQKEKFIRRIQIP